MREDSSKRVPVLRRSKPVWGLLVALMLVTVSVAALAASSGDQAYDDASGMQGEGQAKIEIAYLSHEPEEAVVDEAVEWTVLVEIADPSQRGKGLVFTWDWDDGTSTVYRLKSMTGEDSAVDVQLHSWDAPGTYDVTVSVWDGFENEQSRLHNVSATEAIVVSGEVTDRFVDYCWSDMFNHPLGSWYTWRSWVGNQEFALTDEYPYLYLMQRSPPGNIWVYTFMRLDTSAGNLDEVNMNDNPEFLPFRSDTERGGNAEIDWYLNYITYEEALEKLGPAAMGYFDGWYVALNGTVSLDEQAARAVLDITTTEFDYFDTWWAGHSGEVSYDWEEWMIHEAGQDRLDIFWMYDYPLQFVFFELDAEKVGDEIVLTFDTISWGAEALMTRWLHEAFMPTEWYMEDMDFHASIGPEMADIDFDAAVAYSAHAYESVLDGTPCWTWEAMLQDYVLSGTPPFENESMFDRYWDWDANDLFTYYNRAPGSAWHGETMPYDYAPGAWNLSQGESMSFVWPEGPQMFFLHEPDYSGETLVPDTRQMYYNMSVSYAEPMPSDSGQVSIDELERSISFEGPFDMWTWSKEQSAHSNLASEWDRLGVLPRGVPYIEFAATEYVNTPPFADFMISPPEGTVDTIFEFDASLSWDREDLDSSLMSRWDWENDGAWDTDWCPADVVATHIFPVGDVYEIALEVMDTEGLTDEASRTLTVTGPSTHDPICIIGDDDFTAANGVVGGSGTTEDPYIIEGWEIYAAASNGVYVEGAASSFVIRDVRVYSDGGEETGIAVGLCTGSSVVQDCVAEGFRNGIAAFDSCDVVITRCTCSGNSQVGIFLELCQGEVTVSNNTVFGNGVGGIFNNDSMDTIISGNHAFDNFAGVTVAVFSENVTIMENDISWNDIGVRILYMAGSSIAMDDISIYHNNIVGNPQQVSLNSPEGVVSWDNGYPSGGNYWSDYSGDDLFSGPNQNLPYSDGIGDVPYSLPNGDEDRYPLMSQYPQPPNNAPVAAFGVWPQLGTIYTVFEFDASSSSDVEDPIEDLMVRWDWESDGVWDTDWSLDKTAQHSFSITGAHFVTLEVRDTWGLTDEAECSVWVYEEGGGGPSLTYRISDMFGEDWGPWWTTRVDSAWDTDRSLTTGEGSMTYLYDAFGDESVGIIQTPYRWSIAGSELPNLDVHDPVFLPVMGSGPQPGAEATVHIYGQYLTGSSYDEQWVPYWETTPFWHPDYYDTVVYNDDGWLFGAWVNVTMNREAALEWLGMPTDADPGAWWSANGADYRSDYSTWILEQGNDVYDIFNAYEYPYTSLYGISPYGPIMALEGDVDGVTLRIGDVSWGYEVLLTRWLAASGLSMHQSYMEDFEMTLEYSNATADVVMDAVCHWSMKCVKQNASAVEWGAPCAWAWCPTHADYIQSTATHPDSAYDDYAPLTYQSWNCGDPKYEDETEYEYTPVQFTLPDYGRLVIELPMGEVPGYFAEWVPDEAVSDAFSRSNPSFDAYDDIRYMGEMDLGYCDLSLAAYSEWFSVNKTLIVQGPWAPENPREGDLLYHGAPWIEFNVIPPSLGASTDSGVSSEEIVDSTDIVPVGTSSVAGPTCAIGTLVYVAAIAALACAIPVGRRLR